MGKRMRRRQNSSTSNEGSFGDEEASNSLYNRYATALFNYVRLYVASREDAEDILLDTFLLALENDTFALLSEQKQRAWLYSTARHKIVDRYRSSTRRQFVALEQVSSTLYNDDEQAPEQLALRREESTHLLKLIQRLPVAQQEVLHLRFASGLRCTEIAVLLDKPEGSVRSLLSRALNMLRTIYTE